MDTRAFLGLEQSHNPFRWNMEVTQRVSTSGNFLFGGCGLGAAISAMEGTTGRTTIWATSQYLAYAKPGALVMHPGPMNRGVEIDSLVADGASSLIREQVEMGVAVRMAVLEALAAGVHAPRTLPRIS